MQEELKYDPRLTPRERQAKRILIEEMRERWHRQTVARMAGLPEEAFQLDDDFAIETLLRHGIRASSMSVDLTWLLLQARASA